MAPVGSDAYDAAFANFVLEHVPCLEKAAAEIHRILRPGGLLAATIPNTRAPEFLVARFTPTWVHRYIRRGQAWETQYAYSSVAHLVHIFESSGLSLLREERYACTGGYLAPFPVLATLGRAYDKLVSLGRIRPLMGNVFVAFSKAR